MSSTLKKALPPMKQLLDLLLKKRLISFDDKGLLELMCVDTEELVICYEDDENEDSSNEHDGDASSEISDLDECTEDAKSFALTLYYHSAKAYEYVRSNYRTCLPTLPILWTGYIHPGGVPGFCQETLQAIENKTKTTQDKMYCALSFKSLRDFSVGVQYIDGKGYFGFENFGSEIGSDCQDKAHNATFLMATAINGSWSLPVGYFLLSNTTAKLARMIEVAINLLETRGVNVVSLSYDKFCTSAVEELGCKLRQSEPKTIFKVVNNKKICAFPDYNLIREEICEQLKWFKEFTDGDGNVIAWKYIVQLGKAKGSSESGGDEIITDLDRRMLTRDVASRLKHYQESKSPSFAGVEGTIKFIGNLNDLMEILNSQEIWTDLKQAVTEDNKIVVIEKIDRLMEYFKGMNCKHRVNFAGLVVAAKSLKELINLHLGENGLQSIPAQKLSMDAVDILFGKIKTYAKVQDIRAYKLHLAYKKIVSETELADLM